MPYFVQSCGFFISSNKTTYPGGSYITGQTFADCNKEQTTTFQCNNSTITDNDGNTQGVTIFVSTFCQNNTEVEGLQDPRYADLYNPRRAAFSYTHFTQYLDEDLTTRWPEYRGPNHIPEGNLPYLSGYFFSAFPTCARGCLCGYAINLLQGGSYHDWDPRGEPQRWPYASCGNCNRTFVELFLDWTKIHWPFRIPCTKYWDSKNNPMHDPVLGGDYLSGYYRICGVPVSPSNKTLMERLGLNLTHWFEREYIIDVPENDPRAIKAPFECFNDPIPADAQAVSYLCGPYATISVNATNSSSEIHECGPGGGLLEYLAKIKGGQDALSGADIDNIWLFHQCAVSILLLLFESFKLLHDRTQDFFLYSKSLAQELSLIRPR